ncbi:MAG: redox-sensitive transcriptional activator SoxR [Rhizobiaceae bacterium]
MQTTVNIGEISSRTGLAVSAIRYYEEQGLVKPERNAGGQRRFLRSDIRRLSFVMAAQRFGFTIAEIRQQLQKLPEGRAPTKKDWSKISRSFRGKLDDRIEALTKLRDNLDSCIGCGCLSLQRCKLVNPDDEAAKDGPGPQFVTGNLAE